MFRFIANVYALIVNEHGGMSQVVQLLEQQSDKQAYTLYKYIMCIQVCNNEWMWIDKYGLMLTDEWMWIYRWMNVDRQIWADAHRWMNVDIQMNECG